MKQKLIKIDKPELSWKETIPLQILRGLKRLRSPYEGKDPSFSVLQSGLITHRDPDAPSLSISKVLRVGAGRIFHKD